MLNIRRVARLVSIVAATVAGANGQSPSPGKPDYSQEAFVIEQTRTTLRFENDGTGRRESYMRVKTQSDAGVQAWGQLVLGYNAASERIDIQFVRVRKADGTTVTAPPDAVQDLTSPVQRQAPVYTDYRQKHVTVPGLRPGETLEFSSVTTIQSALAPGQFWTEYDFQKNAVVLDEQLEIDVPAARALTLKTAAGADPRMTEANGRRVYRWTSSDLMPTRQRKEQEEKEAEEHPGRKPKEPTPAAVRMTTFQGWEDVGQWYSALEKAPRTPSPDVRRKAEELTAGRTGDLEKIEALYDFVAKNFRYVSISLGAGRYQPRPAGDVLRDQYGDCKDKHTLLASLLESVGIHASTVLINSRVKMDPDFPSPSQFDHAITRTSAAGQPVWVDVTTEVAPFRLLSANLRKKQALVVTETPPAHLEVTPENPPMVNSLVQDVDGTLEELGRLNVRLRFTVRGDLELFLRVLFRNTPQSSWKDVLEQMNASAGVGGELSDWKVSDPAATKEPFVIEFHVSRPNYIDASKKKVDLPLPFSVFNLPVQDEGDAAFEIELGSPQSLEYRARLELGPTYQARVPIAVSVERDYGKYSASYKLDGKVFTASRMLTLRSNTVPAGRSGDYRAFRRVVSADGAQALALDVNTTTTATLAPELKAADLTKSAYDALRAGNHEQALALLTRVVDLEPKHKTAWTLLGQAHMGLRQYPEAVAAFKKQLELNPYDEFANNNLGAVYVQMRQYADAEATFRKQLEINPLDRWTHGALGRMYVETRRYADAVPELEKAMSLSPDNASFQIDLGGAYLSLGKNDEALVAFTKAAELSATPLIWNNIAYQLSLKGAHLDRALQYAESAVSAVIASARNFSVDHFTGREIGVVQSLGSYWDTLGWVHYAKGDLARAEDLVAASWWISQHAEVGDHLAQIYERQGRRDDAVRMYATALNAERPDAEIRTRLARVAGRGANLDALVASRQNELETQRTFEFAAAPAAGKADFVLLFGADASPEAAAFAGGDEALRPLADAIRRAKIGAVLPADSQARILRRATMTCAAGRCTLVLQPAGDTKPAQ